MRTRTAPLLLTALLALTACSESRAVAPTPAPATPSPTPTAEDPGPGATDFPEDVDLPQHGGRYFAVALAADEPFRTDSLAAVARYGYQAAVADLSCLDGAAASYGLPPSTLVSYLLFATEADAYRFTEAYAAAEDGTQMGVAEVRTYCLD